MEPSGAQEVAKRARGTPRIANRLLRRGRAFAEMRGGGVVTAEMADRALNMLNADERGFDHMDRRLLVALMNTFGGGPVGVASLAAAIREARGTIEAVIDPYLSQQGLLARPPRGRILTADA